MSARSEESDRRVIRFIKDYTAEHGYPPSTREICDEMGYESPSTGDRRIKRLISDGALRQRPNSPRTLTVTERGQAML